jgi:hypothetical protein
MEDKYSLSRVTLLLRRYFLENKVQEMMFWFIIIFIFTVLDQRFFVIAILFISGLIYSIRLHKKLLGGPNGIHFLLIPATHSEKLTAAIFLNTFYHFGMTLLSYAIGNLLITLVYQVLLKIEVPINWDLFISTKTILIDGTPQLTTRNEFWVILGYFSLSQSIFLLGMLCFKKNALLKTLLSMAGTGIFLICIQLILFKSLWDVRYLSNAILPAIILFREFRLPDFVMIFINYICYAFLPIMWVVSYFKLTEKQI